MKKIFLVIFLLPFALSFSQKIGKLAPEKPSEIFPDNAWGFDIMFSEGGFGLGTFYSISVTEDLKGFVDFSISETKDEKEVDYIDPFTGQPFTPGKKNSVFLLPLHFGMKYRVFKSSLSDNLRPYINFAIGPTMVAAKPYNLDFFKGFGDARAHYAIGGYFGVGAYFGTSKTNLIGINLRYYLVRLLDEGVENLETVYRKNINSFYLTINIGFQH